MYLTITCLDFQSEKSFLEYHVHLFFFNRFFKNFFSIKMVIDLFSPSLPWNLALETLLSLGLPSEMPMRGGSYNVL